MAEKIGLEAILEMAGFNKGLKQYTSGVADMEKKTDAAGKGIKGLGDKFGVLQSGLLGATAVIGSVVGAFYTLEKVLAFGKEGAVVQQTTDSFNTLLASIGKGPDFLNEMSAATNNTVDDLTLMSSTLTLVAGTSDEMGAAMVGSAPKLLEIAKAAQKLNPQLGETSFLYNSLATGIKRSSPLILDNLGLTIKLGEANEAMAAKLGKNVEALTAEEKQMALLEATLQAGNRLIQQVGGSVDSATDSYEQLAAEVKNLENELKRKANPTIAKTTKTVLEFVDAMLYGIENTQVLTEELLNASDSYEEYLDAALDAAVANKQLSESDVEVIRRQAEAGEEFHRTVATLGIYSEAHYNALLAVNKLAGGVDTFSEALDPYAEMQREAARATLELAQASSGTTSSLANLADVLSNDATVAAAGFKTELDLLHEAIKGDIGKAFDNLKQKISDLRGELAAGKITQQEFNTAIDEATQAFIDNTNAIIFNIAEKQILDALEKGLIADMNASGTAYDEATVALYALAEGLGIVDEGTLGLTKAVIDQTAAYINGRSSLDDWVGGLGGLSSNMADAAYRAQDLTASINAIPSYKKIVIEYYQSTYGTAPSTPEEGWREPQPYQSGGYYPGGKPIIVGEDGPELMIPSRPGLIIPNGIGMNLPDLAGIGGGGIGGGASPSVQINVSPTINNGMDAAEFEAWTVRTVQRALRGT